VARKPGGQRLLFPDEIMVFPDPALEAGGTRHTGGADRETDAIRATGRIGEADDSPDAGSEVPGFDSRADSRESNPKSAAQDAKNGTP